MLDQHIHFNPHTFALREVLGQRMENAIMAWSNNNLSPECLSQRITFKLGLMWVVYIKVKCGTTERADRKEKKKKEMSFKRCSKVRTKKDEGMENACRGETQVMEGKERMKSDEVQKKCKGGEKRKYLTPLALQLLWSQKDSSLLFCTKTKPGLMSVWDA